MGLFQINHVNWLSHYLLTYTILFYLIKPVILSSHNFNAFPMEFVIKLLNVVFLAL